MKTRKQQNIKAVQTRDRVKKGDSHPHIFSKNKQARKQTNKEETIPG